METLILTSDAFSFNGYFDPRYTCDIDNSSPELRWEGFGTETLGFAVVAEDLETNPCFSHWLVYNIPLNIKHLPAGMPPQESLPNGIKQGINGFGKLGYSGPCPPQGDPIHRYQFRLFSLRILTQLPSRLKREELLGAILPYKISEACLLGYYQRSLQKAG